jgi:hypothetical protein
MYFEDIAKTLAQNKKAKSCQEPAGVIIRLKINAEM